MSEKRGRGQPKFEPTQDQRSKVKVDEGPGNSGGPDLPDDHQPAHREAGGPDDPVAGLCPIRS